MNALANRRFWIFPVLILVFGLLLVVPPALAQDDTQEVELVGLIEAMDSSTITVNQLTVNYTTAEVKTTLAVGAAVKVEGVLLDDGSVQATEITAAETGIQPGESEFTGVLQSFDGSMITVNGMAFDVTNAELESGLQIGDMVKVHATLSADGVWVAREVSRYDADAGDDNSANDNSANDNSGDDNTGNDNSNDNDNSSRDDAEDFEIVGTLDQIGEGFIVVSGQTINTTNAVIEDPLVVGTLVKAEVALVNGDLVAFKVESFASDNSADGNSGDDNSGNDNSNDHSSDDNSGQSGACQFEVKANSINLRTGPGTGYGIIGYGYQGDEYPVIAMHASGAWAHVSSGLGAAWVGLSGGELSGNCAGLSVDDAQFKDASDDSGPGPFDDSSDDNGNSNSSDDMNNDNGDDHGGDDNGSDDHGSDDNNDDHGSDDNGSDDHGSNDNNDDHGGSNDNNDDHGGDDNHDD